MQQSKTTARHYRQFMYDSEFVDIDSEERHFVLSLVGFKLVVTQHEIFGITEIARVANPGMESFMVQLAEQMGENKQTIFNFVFSQFMLRCEDNANQ